MSRWLLMILPIYAEPAAPWFLSAQAAATRGSITLMASPNMTDQSVIGFLATALSGLAPNSIAHVELSKMGRRNDWWPKACAVRHAIRSLRSFGNPAGVLIAIHSRTPAENFPEMRCLVHMTRKPVDMVVSAYLHHLRLLLDKRRCGVHDELCEAWLFEPTSTCNFLPGFSFLDKLDLAPNETAGLLCQLEHSRSSILQMQRMEREVRRRPDVGISFDLAEWKDSGTALHKVQSFCGMDGLAKPTLRAYDRVHAKMWASDHVNLEDDRAEQLREYLYQVGVAESFPDP
jgi:hypothetical protein